MQAPFKSDGDERCEAAECRAKTHFVPENPIYFFSMPSVWLLPGLVAQQKTESLPHFSQMCLISSCFPLPVPTTVIMLLHPGHRCFSPF
jgi:hypothetical protein